MSPNLHAVVMAGGSGTRFWPLSRASRPKQLLALDGTDTLLESTFERVAAVVPPERWWMVVGSSHAEACHKLVPRVPSAQVLAEPRGRNTAPAIMLAAQHLAAVDGDAMMVVLPADHHVEDGAAFCEALRRAAEVAAKGSIVTLGIEPSRPATGYGYIERAAPHPGSDGAFVVRRFCEKPDAERAQRFLAAKSFYWNAGIFVMLPSTYLAEVERQLPDVHGAFQSLPHSIGTASYQDALVQVYEATQSISIDYGVMEGAQDVAVVPAGCGWSDVGSWDALDALVSPDAVGNLVQGRVVATDSQDCVLYNSSNTSVVAAVGVQGLVVVHTPDATLVLPKERAQDVRQVIEALNAKGWQELL